MFVCWLINQINSGRAVSLLPGLVARAGGLPHGVLCMMTWPGCHGNHYCSKLGTS